MLPVEASKKSARKSEGRTANVPKGGRLRGALRVLRGFSLGIVGKAVVEFIRQGLRLAGCAGPANYVHHRKENLSVCAVLVAVGFQLDDGLAELLLRNVLAIGAGQRAQTSQPALAASREFVRFTASI